MKRYWRYITVSALAIIMLMAMAVPALAADKGSEQVLRVRSVCGVSGGGSGYFTFASDQNQLNGRVNDIGDSLIYWSADMSTVKMNQGWERVKAQAAVKVWGDIQGIVYDEANALDGIFSFDLTGITPTEVEGEDLYENWQADGEWTIKVPSMPIANHELGCFGYNFHTGDEGFDADVWKWLVLPI
jgi:hypothetical protein